MDYRASRDYDTPDPPRGAIGSRGWKGEEMEMEHQRATAANKSDRGANPVAVDIRQFQNHTVGEGYQARHVVRQPTAHMPGSMKIKDLSGGSSFGRKEEIVQISDNGERNYIENAGLREFRKEIEAMLSSP